MFGFNKIPKYQWPDTSPIDKTDPHWKFNNNLSVNGTQYKKSEVSPGKWQWVINEEAMESKRKSEQHRRELYWALRSRILTDAEMAEVAQYGLSLVTEEMVPYQRTEKEIELNNALLQQFRMRQKEK